MARFDTAVVAATLGSCRKGLLSQTVEYGGGPSEKFVVSFLSRRPVSGLAHVCIGLVVGDHVEDGSRDVALAFDDASRAAPRVRVPQPIRMPHSRGEICPLMW
jgi:hypothetical protein